MTSGLETSHIEHNSKIDGAQSVVVTGQQTPTAWCGVSLKSGLTLHSLQVAHF
jgi:hypothetical protein